MLSGSLPSPDFITSCIHEKTESGWHKLCCGGAQVVSLSPIVIVCLSPTLSTDSHVENYVLRKGSKLLPNMEVIAMSVTV